MTRTEHDQAARRRGQLTRDRGARRLLLAIDAQRRLNAERAGRARTKADPYGPSDRRYSYLTESHV